MRDRERRQAARKIRDVCETAAPRFARSLRVLWARDLCCWATGENENVHAIAIDYGKTYAIVFCEARWTVSSEAERADTVAHELAHLVADATAKRDNVRIREHGREWKREHRRILEIAEGIDWT